MPNLANNLGDGPAGGWAPADGLFKWDPDLAPETPNALDDEFTGPGLDAKWTTGNPGGNFSVSVDSIRRVAKCASVGNTANRFGWIIQSLGSVTEGAFYCKVGMITQAINTQRAGLIIGPSTLQSSPTTAPFHDCVSYVFNASNRGGRAENYTNYTTFAATTLEYQQFPVRYCRMRLNGTALERDISNDGIEWYRLAGSIVLPYTPAYIGLTVDVSTNGLTGYGLFKFFRATTGAGSSGIDANAIGRQSSQPIYP